MSFKILVEERHVSSNMDTEDAARPMHISSLDAATLSELKDRYYKNGFVIFEKERWTPTEELIVSLADELNLGEAYFTDRNRKTFSEQFTSEHKLNAIAHTKDGRHAGFNTTNDLGLHSDGTFEPIGTIPTTILVCEQEATTGGDSILFDSVKAFELLAQIRPDWAEALLDRSSFRKYSTYSDGYECIDSAFRVVSDGDIISRFSTDDTSDWEYGFSKVPHLREAVGFLTGLIPRGSGFSTIMKLRTNQGILFANDKIAHGRTSFIDDLNAPRKMVRGNYLERPS